jgi:hypothetical protein
MITHTGASAASLLAVFSLIAGLWALYATGMWCRARVDADEWEAAFWAAYRHALARREHAERGAVMCPPERWGPPRHWPAAGPPAQLLPDELILAPSTSRERTERP